MTKQIFDTSFTTSALYSRRPITIPLKHQFKQIEGFQYSNEKKLLKVRKKHGSPQIHRIHNLMPITDNKRE